MVKLSVRGYLKQFCRIGNHSTFHSLLFLSDLVSPPGTAQQAALHGLIHCLTPYVQCHPGTHPWCSSSGAAAVFQALLPPQALLSRVYQILWQGQVTKKKNQKKNQPMLLHWNCSEGTRLPQSYQLLLLVVTWLILI